jgi:hypothetical protein
MTGSSNLVLIMRKVSLTWENGLARDRFPPA